MNPVFFTRGLCAAALLLSLAACGGGGSGSGFDAGSLGATAAGKPAPTAETSDGSTADNAASSSPSVSWAP